MARRILLTGGAGFIGSQVADRYVAAGCELLILDDLSTGRAELVPEGARFEEVDVSEPRAAELVREFRPELVNLHAAQLDVRRSVADPLFDARVNVLGLVNILQAAVDVGCGRALFASSGGTVYGEQQVFPAGEDHPTEPISPYGVAKLAGEKYLQYYAGAFAMNAMALRYANIYGPRQNPHGEAGVVAIFCERMLAVLAGDASMAPVINGDGGQTRDYTHVSDVVEANVLATERLFAEAPGRLPFEAINVGTGSEADVTDIWEGLAVALGYAQPREHGPAKPGEQRRSVIDPARAGELLGWKPQVGLREGLAETAAWFREGA